MTMTTNEINAADDGLQMRLPMSPESTAEFESRLQAAGFRYYDKNPAMGGWYAGRRYARIVTDYIKETVGVEIYRTASLAEFAIHEMDGTYDALPIAEKHRLSGAGGTLESWLELFDRCGKPRPGDGCK